MIMHKLLTAYTFFSGLYTNLHVPGLFWCSDCCHVAVKKFHLTYETSYLCSAFPEDRRRRTDVGLTSLLVENERFWTSFSDVDPTSCPDRKSTKFNPFFIKRGHFPTKIQHYSCKVSVIFPFIFTKKDGCQSINRFINQPR